jgi:hypothetical protein
MVTDVLEADSAVETPETIYDSTRRKMPEDFKLHHYHCQNLKHFLCISASTIEWW